MLAFLKSIWRLTPIKFRSRIARFRLAWSDQPLILAPSYADDGLVSQHIVDFLKDLEFLNAYDEGKKTGALKGHPGDIHFRAYIACWAAKQALSLNGDFVECGVGKGLLSKTIAVYLNFEKLEKKFYLFDTYEGIPIQDAQDGLEQENMTTLNDVHFNSDYFLDVKKTFSKYSNVEIIKGRIPDSLLREDIVNISYLSIDMNNALAEISAIDYLFDKIVPGGIVLLDDYAYAEEFRKQKDAWDEFAEIKKIQILTLPTGQGMIIKI